MDCCIIVSRFNEDISSLNNYKEFKIIIYNKGNELKKDNFKEIIKLKNVGRESHTWLNHIVENYYNLNDSFSGYKFYFIQFKIKIIFLTFNFLLKYRSIFDIC